MINSINSDKFFISQLDNALMKSGLPENKLNRLLKMAEAHLRCDSECQRREKIEEYKKTWDKSKELYASLPNIIAENEKKYYLLEKGPSYYKDKIEKKKYTDLIMNFRKMQMDKLENFKEETNSLLNNYKSAQIYKKRINELHKEKERQNTLLTESITDSEKKVSTDVRKIYYEDQQTVNLRNYRKIIYIFYYIIPPLLFIVYLIYGPFFNNKEYRNYKKVLLLLFIVALYIFIAVPKGLIFIVEKIFQLVDYLSNLKIF